MLRLNNTRHADARDQPTASFRLSALAPGERERSISLDMRRLFSKLSASDFVDPPGPINIVWARVRAVGPYAIVFSIVSCLGLVFGLFFGTTIVPGRSNAHLISLSDSPTWFLIAMSVNAVVAVFSVGYTWYRILGK